MKNCTYICFTALIIMSTLLSSCQKEKDDDINQDTTFERLESPYLICSSRNPGGVGFDFEYQEELGGANNMDSLSVTDFEYDIKIRTIKGEKPDGTLGGAPFIQLYETVQAVNYSAIDTTCKGYAEYAALSTADLLSFDWQYDDSSFDLTTLQTGETGSPLMQNLNQEFQKLVMGQFWKETANNEIENDELVWLIKTREDKIVKFIVTDFPADPAPTSTGYISIEWSFVE
jgi:hypothetical protein